MSLPSNYIFEVSKPTFQVLLNVISLGAKHQALETSGATGKAMALMAVHLTCSPGDAASTCSHAGC